MQPAIHHISSDPTPISNLNLSPAQAQVVTALAQGRTVSAAARQAGVHRTTIHHWLRHEPEFKAAVQAARREYVDVLNDNLRELASGALEALHKLLDDPATPSTVRLKTALAILERPQFPDPGWNLPERIESVRQRQVLEGLAKIEAGSRAMRIAE